MFKVPISSVAILLLLQQSAICQSGVALDKLSDCNGLARISAKLRGPVTRECRNPSNAIEKSLLSRLVSPRNTACLLSSPPASRLEGFSCIDLLTGDDRELSCFRTMDSSALNDYSVHYDRDYRDSAVSYLEDASKCGAGKRDAAASKQSLFPIIFTPISKFRFGFVLVLDEDKNHYSRAYHGYADLDPSLVSDRRATSVEIFDVFRLGHAYSETLGITPDHSSRKFSIGINDAWEARQQMQTLIRRQFRQKGTAKVRIFEIKYHGQDDIAASTRKVDLDKWQSGVAAVLKNAGYRELTDAEKADTGLTSPDAIGDFVTRNSPIGQRDTIKAAIDPHVVFLISDRYPSCTQISEVMIQKPTEEVLEDYGGISVMLIGIGECSDAAMPGGSLSDGLIEKSTQYLMNEANSR